MAERMRAKIRRSGIGPGGHLLWTEEEDRKVRDLYPDYRALKKALRRRTLKAIRLRAAAMEIVYKRHCWTAAEVSRMRKLYPSATKSEVCAAFPELRWTQITGKVQHARIHKLRKPLSSTGIPIIDEIRTRAFTLNYSMADLDAIARTRRYFQKGGWLRSGINKRAIYRAIEALDGKVRADWS